jgi:hypothetical protein
VNHVVAPVDALTASRLSMGVKIAVGLVSANMVDAKTGVITAALIHIVSHMVSLNIVVSYAKPRKQKH